MPPFYQRATNNSSVQCTYTFPRRSQLVDEKIWEWVNYSHNGISNGIQIYTYFAQVIPQDHVGNWKTEFTWKLAG